MGQDVFAACAPAIEAGSVLAFMENWDEGKEEWPSVWRYTFDGEQMHRQEGAFTFEDKKADREREAKQHEPKYTLKSFANQCKEDSKNLNDGRGGVEQERGDR